MGGGVRPTRGLVLLVLAAAALAAVPSSALAVSKRDRAGDVRAKGLTSAERKALDITRVKASATTFGLDVKVTLRGNFQAAIAPHQLADGGAALVVKPASGHKIVVAREGSGSGGRIVTTGTAGPAAVVVQRNTIEFLARTKLKVPAVIDVKTFASTLRGHLRGRVVTGAGEAGAGALAAAPGVDDAEAKLTEHFGTGFKDCAQIDSLGSELASTRSELGRRIAADNAAALDSEEELAHTTDPAKRAELQGDIDRSNADEESAAQQITELDGLIDALAEYKQTHCHGSTGGTGTTTGGGGTTTGGGQTGGSGGNPPPFSCSASTTKNVVFHDPYNDNDPYNNTAWQTGTTGKCNGDFDTFEVRVLGLSNAGINDFVAETETACKMIDDHGTEYSQNPDGSYGPPPAGQYFVAIRCTRKPTKQDFYAYFKYTNGTPPSGTHIQVTIVKDGVAQQPIDTVVP